METKIGKNNSPGYGPSKTTVNKRGPIQFSGGFTHIHGLHQKTEQTHTGIDSHHQYEGENVVAAK